MPNTPEFDITAARFVLGLATSDQLLRAAHSMIDNGTDTPSLIAAISTRHPEMADVEPLFLSACDELGKELPSAEAATNQVIRYYLKDIAEGEVRPFIGMQWLLSDIHRSNRSSVEEEFVGDSHKLQHLIATYYAFDDLSMRAQGVSLLEAEDDLDSELMELALAWLADNDG